MAVHFYVTIPTESEELWLRCKWNRKQFDQHTDTSFENISKDQLWKTNDSSSTFKLSNLWTTSLRSKKIGSSSETITSSSRITASPSRTTTSRSRKTSLRSGTTTPHSQEVRPRSRTITPIRVSSRSGTATPRQRTITPPSSDTTLRSSTLRSRSRTMTPSGVSSRIRDSSQPTDSTKTVNNAEINRETETASAFRPATENKPLKRDVELDLSKDACMVAVLQEVLKKYQLETAVWTDCTGGRMRLVNFPVEFPEVQEQIKDIFREWGIGRRFQSTVSVFNCMVFMSYTQNENFIFNDEFNNIYAHKLTIWTRFIEAVRCKLNVRQIVRNVRENGKLTFDFYVLVVASAVLAAVGLVENSRIFLFSSMLLSPLIGPIVAGIFGTAINDRSLLTLGLRNELIGTFLGALVGFMVGLAVYLSDKRYATGECVTAEMFARCEKHSLWVGLFTAIPSGAAAAVSILVGNISSLVGVAVSAAILPAAVNAGVLWSLAVIYKLYEHDKSANQGMELTVLGIISLCLALLNISCVYLMGVLTLKIKEKAPAVSYKNRKFWKNDIGIARKLTKKDMDSDEAIMNEFAQLPKREQETMRWDCEYLQHLRANEERQRLTWPPPNLAYRPGGNHDFTENEFKRVYATITNQIASPGQNARCGLVHPAVKGAYHESRKRFVCPFTKKSCNANFNNKVDAFTAAPGTYKIHRFVVSPVDESSGSLVDPSASADYPCESLADAPARRVNRSESLTYASGSLADAPESLAYLFEWMTDSCESQADRPESLTDASESLAESFETQADLSKSQSDRSEPLANPSQSLVKRSDSLADPPEPPAAESEA